MIIGLIALRERSSARSFFPTGRSDDYTMGFDADPGPTAFVEWRAGFLNSPLFRGRQGELLQNGDGFYPAMLEAIRGAKDTVNFEVYIFEPDEIGRQFMDAFMDRARAGVEVRLLVDGFGSFKLKRRHREELSEAGVKVERFRPLALRNLVRIYRRTHRRAIVIDGRIGFTGGAAISKKWAGNVPNTARVAGQHDPGDRPAGRRDPVGLRRELGLLHRRGARRAPVLSRARPPATAPAGVSVVSSPSDAHAADPAAVLAQLHQRPRPAVDLQLLLHPRPASAESGDGAGAARRGRADPGAGQSHRRDSGAARRAELLPGAARGRACGSSSFSRR